MRRLLRNNARIWYTRSRELINLQLNFRVAQSNHRAGPYNAPSEVFAKNPYISQVGATGLETFLGTPGTVQLASDSAVLQICQQLILQLLLYLNVDTKSLSDQPQGDFFGYAAARMELKRVQVVVLQQLYQT